MAMTGGRGDTMGRTQENAWRLPRPAPAAEWPVTPAEPGEPVSGVPLWVTEAAPNGAAGLTH